MEAYGHPVGIVGESNYQDAIKRCKVGEEVEVVREPTNPHDNLALAVLSERGEVIGYIPRKSWLRKAIHKEGRNCVAHIISIAPPEPGLPLGVVIDVFILDRGAKPKTSRRSVKSQTSNPRKGWIARLLGL